MNLAKKSLIVGAGVATIGLTGMTGASLVSAATNNTSTTGDSSLVDKLASKFGLNKADVQAVFDANRAEHMAEMQTKRADALKQAVTDGKITQAQADHITAVWKEIDALRGTTKPEDMSTATRDQIKQKMDDLHTWMQQQNINLSSLGMMGRGHGHGFGGPGMDHDGDDTSSTTSTTN